MEFKFALRIILRTNAMKLWFYGKHDILNLNYASYKKSAIVLLKKTILHDNYPNSELLILNTLNFILSINK